MGCVPTDTFNDTHGLELCITNWKLLYVLFDKTYFDVYNRCNILGAIYQISAITKKGQDIKLVVPVYNALDLPNFNCFYEPLSNFLPKTKAFPFYLSDAVSYKLDNMYCIAYCLLIQTLFRNSGQELDFLWDCVPPLFRFQVKAVFYSHLYSQDISIISHFVWTKEHRTEDVPVVHIENVHAHVLSPSGIHDSGSEICNVSSEILCGLYQVLSRGKRKGSQYNYRLENNKKISPIGEALLELFSSDNYELCIENFKLHDDHTNSTKLVYLPCQHRCSDKRPDITMTGNDTMLWDQTQIICKSVFNDIKCVTVPNNDYLCILIDHIGMNYTRFSQKVNFPGFPCLLRVSDKLDNMVGGALAAYSLLYLFEIPDMVRNFCIKPTSLGVQNAYDKLSLEYFPILMNFSSGQLYNTQVPIFYSHTYMRLTNGLKCFNPNLSRNLFYKYVFTMCMKYFFRQNKGLPSLDFDRPSSYLDCEKTKETITTLQTHSKMIQIIQGNIRNGILKCWPGLYIAKGRIMEIDVKNCYATLLKNRSQLCKMFIEWFITARQHSLCRSEAAIYKQFMCELFGNMKKLYPSLYEEVLHDSVQLSLKIASFICQKNFDPIRIVKDGFLFIIPSGEKFDITELISYIGENGITFTVEDVADIAIVSNVNTVAILRSNAVIEKGITSVNHAISVTSIIYRALEALLCKYMNSSLYSRYTYEAFITRMCDHLVQHLKLFSQNSESLDIYLHPFNGRSVQPFTHWIHFRDYPINCVTDHNIPTLFGARDFVSVKTNNKLDAENDAANWVYSLECKGNSRIIDITSCKPASVKSIWNSDENAIVLKSKLVSRNCLLNGYEIDENLYYSTALAAIRPVFVTVGHFLHALNPSLVTGIQDFSKTYMEIVDKVTREYFPAYKKNDRSISEDMKSKSEEECLEIFRAQTSLENYNAIH